MRLLPDARSFITSIPYCGLSKGNQDRLYRKAIIPKSHDNMDFGYFCYKAV